MAVFATALLLLVRLREAHLLRRGVTILVTTGFIALSLMHPSLEVSMAALIVSSLLAIAPIALTEFDETKESKIRSLLSFDFLSYILLIFAFLLLSNANDKYLIAGLLALSAIFRCVLPFCSHSLVDVLLLMPGSQRALFFLSSFAFSIFANERLLKIFLQPNEQLLLCALFISPVGVSSWNAFKASSIRERLLYLCQIIVLLPFATSILDSRFVNIFASLSFLAIAILAQSNAPAKSLVKIERFEIDVKVSQFTLTLFQRISRFCRRIAGPVIVEWLVLRIPTGAIIVVRLASRLISYASTPRVLATSLLVSFIMLVYILRL